VKSTRDFVPASTRSLAHSFCRFHRANAALRAISDRCSGVSFRILAIALFLPPPHTRGPRAGTQLCESPIAMPHAAKPRARASWRHEKAPHTRGAWG